MVAVAARERFQRTMGLIPQWVRVVVAKSTRELAAAGDGASLAELAALVETATFNPAATSEEPTSLAPDHEGDEELLEQRGKMRAGWRGA